jgi:DNA polymerase III epsilon subunit family exonuclease
MDLNRDIEDFNLVFFDLETTGLDAVKGDCICEIGALKWHKRKIIDKFHTLINPQRPIPQEAYLIHKIADKDVCGAPTFGNIADNFIAFLKDSILLAYNIEFDLSFINYELSKIGRSIPELPTIDILCMARKTLSLEKYNLGAVASFFNIEDTGKLHRALNDSFAAAWIFFKLRGILKENKLNNLGDFVSLYGLTNNIFKSKEGPKVALIKEAMAKQLFLRVRYFSYRNTMEEEEIKPISFSQENNNHFLWCSSKSNKSWRININRFLDMKIV